MSGGPYGRGKAPERAVMPLQQWPTRDRDIWLLAVAPVNPFADHGGDRADLRMHSNQRLRSSYGRWLTFLQRSGRLATSHDPGGRIGKDTVEQYCMELQSLGNMPSTIALRLTDLLLMARLFEPKADWRFIKTLADRMRARETPPKEKRQRLRGTDELYTLGRNLIEMASSLCLPAKAASCFRDGLIIALLALVPLRRRNFVQLRLGQELRKAGGTWQVDIAGATTKTHAPLSFDWPSDLVLPLETYLHIHRPILAARSYRKLDRAGEQLWVSSCGSALTEVGLYDIVRKRTKTAFGIAINPHAFRDAAATTLAIHDPEHVRVAAPVLGHRSLATTEKYYNQARSLDAHRRYTDVLARWRSPSPKVPA